MKFLIQLVALILVFMNGFHKDAYSQDNLSKCKPNIILLLIDDLGYADLGITGNRYIQTPNIDKLAKESLVFTQAYSSSPVCSPTRAAILSGRNPAAMGIKALGDMVPKDEVFISQKLKEAGYTTAILGKWHLKRNNSEKQEPIQNGFTFQKGVNGAGQPATYFYPFKDNSNQQQILSSINDLDEYAEGTFLTDALANEASNFIQRNKEKPFFMYMSFYAVHNPIMAKQEKVEKYARISDPDHKNSPEFAALTETVDDAVGKILQTLKENNLDQNTVIILVSDNGGLAQNSNNNPYREGKGAVYEGGIRTPMLVKWPGVTKENTKSRVPVISSDLAPTIADIAGAEWTKAPNDLNGYSLLPILKNPKEKLPRESLFWLYYPTHYHYKDETFRIPAEVIHKGDWKLIHFRKCIGFDDHYELYNLKKDVGETHNLADSNPKKLKELSIQLQSWLKSTKVSEYNADEYIQRILDFRKRK